jgi:hypothetical protein
MSIIDNTIDKIKCAFAFHDWSSPVRQQYSSPYGWLDIPPELVCHCTRKGCSAKQMWIDGR